MLLAGLLSDTLILTSPTTTERDRRAAERLGRWAFVRSFILAGETVTSYGQQVLRAGSGLETRDPQEIVSTDLKIYEAGGQKFAIAQVEVTNLVQLDEHLEPLRKALDELRQRRGLDFAMLMVTDVVDNHSCLVTVNAPPVLDDLPYPRQPDGTYLAEGVVSRKKQLLPSVLGLLEE
jgi:manganese-dependent inorganic pyrophosphatase